MPKADSTIANLVDHFDASSLRIAEDHLTSGRVRQFLVPVLGTFCGQIMLNERYSHDARIIVDIETSAILSTDCTCHKGSRCSHCAALVLKLLELSGVPFCIRAKRKAARKRVSKGGKKAPELKRQLVYLVPPKPSSASPEITVVTYTYERLRDRLGYLMSQPRRGNRKTFKSVWKSPPVYANDDDIEIAKRWTSVSGRSPYTWRADGEEEKDFDRACDRRTFDALFTQVLETRRCILNMVPEVKLVLGEALPGVFVLDRAGRKQWQVEIKAKRGIKFLPCLRWKHPWYFDSRTGLCGPVVVDADSAEITRLLELRAEGDYQRSRLSSLLVDVNNAMLPEIPSDIQDLQQAPAPQFRTDCPDMRADISPGPRLSEIIISEAADPASADIAPIPFEPGAGSGTGSLIDAYLQATCSDPQIGSQDCTSCGGQQFSTYRTDVLDGQDILDRDEDTGPRLSVPDTKQQEPQTDQLVLELAIKNTVCQKPIFDEGRYVIARIGESVKVLTLSLSDAVSEDGRSGNGHPVTTQELELLRKGSKWITDFGFMRVAPQAVEMHDESVEPPGGRFVFVATASRQWTRLNSDALEKLRAAGLKISNEVEEQLLPSSIECSDICFDVEEKSDWWYSLSLKIEVAGKTVSLLPLLITAIRSLQTSTKISESIEKLNKNGRFEGVLADGTVVSLPFERIRAILLSLQDVLLRGAPGNVLSISALHVAELLKDKNFKKSKWHGAERLISLAGQLNSIKHTRSEAEPPSSFKGELRPYQKEGLAWLKRMAQAGFGGILADDMGLG
ncbi:MAG: DEAD/DEAH box helicase, partial [Candidatus Obscuribacterales bacterium]|nr:DEAD/DEAH box helicase [Candidatus Obscuribacterales bacterium]